VLGSGREWLELVLDVEGSVDTEFVESVREGVLDAGVYRV
jgi:hypothetical protein